MIRVLVVEDSLVSQKFLTHTLDSAPDIHVVGTASDGDKAIKAAKRLKPHVITMDINMPKMDGYKATQRIMETNPTPIVMVTASYDPKEIAKTFKALEAGAVSVIQKPGGVGHPDHEKSVKELIQTVRLMSEVKVVTRRPHLLRRQVSAPVTFVPKAKPRTEIEVVAIGASTGGPIAIQTILSELPMNFPVPVLIVQHVASGFVRGFVEWLAQSTGFPVGIASHDELLLPGHAYIAPDDHHIGIQSNKRIALSRKQPENGLRPSISHLFRSVANVFGANAIGVLLTGMGKDGAAELKLMKDAGALTMAQDDLSSVVFGMPGEAIKLGAVNYVLPPDGIGTSLVRLLGTANHEVVI